jgi:excisionase family DNA binding protein
MSETQSDTIDTHSGGQPMSTATIMDAQDLPAVLTMGQVQQLLGLSRPKTYELANRQGFPVVRFGRALRVPKAALLRWLEQEAEGENNGR